MGLVLSQGAEEEAGVVLEQEGAAAEAGVVSERRRQPSEPWTWGGRH